MSGNANNRFFLHRSEQLLAFFKQWNPHSESLDGAEQNGFIDASTVEDNRTKNMRSTYVVFNIKKSPVLL